MSARDKKDARRIQADFTFENTGQSGRHGHGGGRRDRERDRDRDREREPPPHQQASSSTPAPAAPVARPPGIGRRREGFGAALTQPDQEAATITTTTNATARTTRPMSPQVPVTTPDVDPAVAECVSHFKFWDIFSLNYLPITGGMLVSLLVYNRWRPTHQRRSQPSSLRRGATDLPSQPRGI